MRVKNHFIANNRNTFENNIQENIQNSTALLSRNSCINM